MFYFLMVFYWCFSRFYKNYMTNIFWWSSHVSRAQVLANIGSVLEAFLNYCDDNMGSLTQEERSSFMDEHSRLSGVWSNKDATHSTLLQVLNECEELKLRIQTACWRHKEDSIRRGPVPPAATTIVDPHAQLLADIDSALKDFLNYYIKNLDSLPKEQQFSFEIEYSNLSGVRSNEDATYSTLLKVLNVFKELKLRTQTECRKHQVDCIRRTLASPIATTIADTERPASSITPMNCNSPYETPPESPISVQSDIASTNGSQLGPSCPSTDTSGSTVSSGDSEAYETSSITSPVSTEGDSSAPPTVTDCMIFDGASSADSPTFNIDSKEATENFFTYGGSLYLRFSGQPPAGARQPQTDVNMNGVM
ncbi:hypothetical protein EDD22DRAFT_305624 [Suillus occidentalis]|nr:hypothetical protein EDD22DRAFT_305624 [Suillus occidentalis]